MLVSLRIITLYFVLLFGAAAIRAAHPECTNPSIRKEWRTLSTAERAHWISSVKCFANLPHNTSLTSISPPVKSVPQINTSGSAYDDLVYIHMDVNTLFRYTGLFFPWHRYYVDAFDKLLRDKCAFNGAQPYWNWTQDAHDVYGSSIMQEGDAKSGIGGWGDPANDYEVPDGAFASGFALSYPAYHRLRRNFTLQPYLARAGDPFYPDPAKLANTSLTESEVKKMVTGFTGDFKGLQTYMEAFQGAHVAAHRMVGGDSGGTCPGDAPPGCKAGPLWSPNDPALYWMHHTMVDKVWSDWQDHNVSQNFFAYEGGMVQAIENVTRYEKFPNGAPPALHFDSVMPASGILPHATVGDVMNTTGGYLCYRYE